LCLQKLVEWETLKYFERKPGLLALLGLLGKLVCKLCSTKVKDDVASKEAHFRICMEIRKEEKGKNFACSPISKE
jgi:hypothetical protein